ncbi:hypothetical protein K469DRAFT_695814 [Zopfia rhizophila CBS 207.26]|uniref:Zn(2)-C6 fungal-type domain-containing protein n=1 Tax=Zopfia rhizophila CBS 207.26 TaxID=1314779 RepID=A0A6A6EHW8_9PEZI|nr:hypothetical protein K469DRAFT_695814 [Zopfia rhizophila CBS 207.26]
MALPGRIIVRNRPSLSCYGCRRRKIKCEKQRPACANCVRWGSECKYDNHQGGLQRKKITRNPRIKGRSVITANQTASERNGPDSRGGHHGAPAFSTPSPNATSSPAGTTMASPTENGARLCDNTPPSTASRPASGSPPVPSSLALDATPPIHRPPENVLLLLHSAQSSTTLIISSFERDHNSAKNCSQNDINPYHTLRTTDDPSIADSRHATNGLSDTSACKPPSPFDDYLSYLKDCVWRYTEASTDATPAPASHEEHDSVTGFEESRCGLSSFPLDASTSNFGLPSLDDMSFDKMQPPPSLDDFDLNMTMSLPINESSIDPFLDLDGAMGEGFPLDGMSMGDSARANTLGIGM